MYFLTALNRNFDKRCFGYFPDSKRALDAFLNATGKALKKGESVVLIGFGTFKTATRAARNGRNPQTGKVIKIKAKKVVKFKAGTELTKKVK